MALIIIGYSRFADSGGNPILAFNSYVSGNGPIAEKDMPLSLNDTNPGAALPLSSIQNKKPITKITDFVLLPSMDEQYKNTAPTYEKNYYRNMIKQHIIQNGAVTAATYVGSTEWFPGSDFYDHYNDTTDAYYYDGFAEYPDHSIVIIGWDDNYDKNNFKEGHQPQNNGAYLVQTSWGNMHFLNNGTYYISYEDPFIESDLMGVKNTQDVNYDNLYQHDPLGMDYVIGDYSTLYAANVFTKDANYIEQLNEVSIATFFDVKCTIYVNSANGTLHTDISKFKQVSTGNILTPGYHTIKLSSPINLTGSKFVIVVKYEPINGVACITMERPEPYTSWMSATTKAGESYLLDSNKWLDLANTYIESEYGGYELIYANLCVKAFTTKSMATKVSGVKATSAGYNSIKLSWSKVFGATGYKVYRATSSSGTYSLVKTITSGDILSYTNTGLTTGKTYYYKIMAIKGSLSSAYSSVVSAKPTLAKPTATVKSGGYNSIKVSWNKISGATGYKVYRATSSGGKYSLVKTITSGSTVSYTNTGLTAGKKYYYKIIATRGTNKSSYSGIVNTKPIPKTPTLTTKKSSSTSIKNTWGKVSGASGYEVYMMQDTGAYKLVKTITKGTTISYTKTKLTKGYTYYFKVRAYKIVSGKKVYSNYSSVKSIRL